MPHRGSSWVPVAAYPKVLFASTKEHPVSRETALYVYLGDEVMAILRRMAAIDKREPRQQAEYVLEQALRKWDRKHGQEASP
jgi:hypothetical protein